MTRKEWIQVAQNQLEAAKSPTPRLDAEVLLAHVQQVERIQLHMYPERAISDEDNAVLEDLISRRTAGEPVAYLTGKQEFMGLTFYVSPAVLIPRPDTELLVETTLENLKGMHCQRPEQPLLAADIGTGSGCIAVSLAVLLPQVTVLAVDLSPEALAVANRNREFHGVTDQVIPLQGNLLEPVREWLQHESYKLDAIISNPPYISEAEMKELAPSVAAYEPHRALAGGTDGLDAYRQITAKAPGLLRSGGLLAFEIGYRQGKAVCRLMNACGFIQVQILTDLAGLDRVVLGRMP